MYFIVQISLPFIAGLSVVGKKVLGLNPLHLNNLNSVMDKSLRGHPYVKSAIGTVLALFFCFCLITKWNKT